MKYTLHALVICTFGLLSFFLPDGIASQVLPGSLYGVVCDVNGAWVPRAKIVAELKYSERTGNLIFETSTDDVGRFKLENLPPGSYEVRVSFAGSEAQLERVVSVQAGRAIEIAFEFGHGCDRITEGSAVINDADKGEVVKLTLLQTINLRSKLLEQKQRDDGVILSTQNIRPEWVRNLPGIRIRLMSQSQIQRKADREGDFMYLTFPELRVRGACIAVSIANRWVIGRTSRATYLSGGGYTYEYRRESGKWIGRFVSGWVS